MFAPSLLSLFSPLEAGSKQLSEHWFEVKDGDPIAVDLFQRHYSSRKLGFDHYRRYGITGPGETIVLLLGEGNGLFVWRLERFRKDGQSGINCAVFRNESNILASDLIKEASEIARQRWTNERLFTFVCPQSVKSHNPGYCYKKAGWQKCGKTQKGLLIFELNGN